MGPSVHRFSGRVILGVLAALGGIAPVPGAAADPGNSALAASPDSALAAALAVLPGQRLPLEEAVALAARQSAAAGIAEARFQAATGAVRREKGVFDPELFGNADWAGLDSPSASLFAGADVLQTETTDLRAGARMALPLGTELSLSLSSLRTTSNSSFAALSPQYDAGGSLTLRQPLLKGFGPAAGSDLRFAQESLAGAGARLQNARLALRAEVETTYWALYAAERNHAVTLLIRDRAAAFLADTRLRAKAGLSGPSEVASAEYFLTDAQQSVLDTEEQLDRLSDRLGSLMGRRPEPGQVRYRALDEPPREFPAVDQDSLVAVAQRRSPELQAMASDVMAQRARERGARWDAMPTLDLVGGLGAGGLSGSPRDVYFPGSDEPVRTAISGGRGESLDQVLGRDYPSWNVGLVFALPLGGREGKGERDRLAAEVTLAEQQMVGARRLLEEEVRARHRDLERGRQRLEIATEGVRASVRQVQIGMVEYSNGRSTAFEVVRLAADLATAQQRYSQALVRTAHAAAVLRQLTGGWYPDFPTKER